MRYDFQITKKRTLTFEFYITVYSDRYWDFYLLPLIKITRETGYYYIYLKFLIFAFEIHSWNSWNKENMK